MWVIFGERVWKMWHISRESKGQLYISEDVFLNKGKVNFLFESRREQSQWADETSGKREFRAFKTVIAPRRRSSPYNSGGLMTLNLEFRKQGSVRFQSLAFFICLSDDLAKSKLLSFRECQAISNTFEGSDILESIKSFGILSGR